MVELLLCRRWSIKNIILKSNKGGIDLIRKGIYLYIKFICIDGGIGGNSRNAE